MENGLKFLVSGVSMSAETAGHRFLGDDLKKSAIITFCFYIIAFVLFSALVFGTTLRLKLKYIQCESLAACCALFFVSIFVLLRTSDVFRNRRAVWFALVPSVFFCGAYGALLFQPQEHICSVLLYRDADFSFSSPHLPPADARAAAPFYQGTAPGPVFLRRFLQYTVYDGRVHIVV